LDVVAERFAVYFVSLEPARGHEMSKTRPCVAVSPDQVHRHLKTVLIAPLTSRRRGYPTRVACTFSGRRGEIALDQMRAVDVERLQERVGQLDAATAKAVRKTLLRMFA
jgi:mRNA interferase MazF